MTCIIPKAISASLDTVRRKRGNTLGLDRRGDDEAGEIYMNGNGQVFSMKVFNIYQIVTS